MILDNILITWIFQRKWLFVELEFLDKINLDFSSVTIESNTGISFLSVSATIFEIIAHFPEIILFTVALFAWIFSPFSAMVSKDNQWARTTAYILLLSILAAVLLTVSAMYFYDTEKGTLYVWFDTLISDFFIIFLKIVLLSFGFVVLLFLLADFNKDGKKYWFFLMVFTLMPGFSILMSTNDFLSFFAVIEFISLTTYVLPVVANWDKDKGISAAAKYYSVGAIAAALLLAGIIVVSAESNSFNFDDIELSWSYGNFTHIQFFGLMLILCALAMKVSIFPAFAWVFDVYTGSSYAVLIIFAVISKLSTLGLFIRLYITTWPWLYQHYVLPVFYLSVITIILGMLGAFYSFNTDNLKAFIGYTGVNQIGYIFMGLCVVDSLDVFNASVYYLVLYLIANLVFISALAYLSVNGYEITKFDQLSLHYARRHNPSFIYPIVLIGVSIWAMAGLPPFGNFFAKITLWSSLLHLFTDFFVPSGSNLYLLFNPQFFIDLYSAQILAPFILLSLIVVSVLTSIISIYYYVGLIGSIIYTPVLADNKEFVENKQKGALNTKISFIWFSGMLVLLIILCGWFFALDDPFLVPECFIRII